MNTDKLVIKLLNLLGFNSDIINSDNYLTLLYCLIAIAVGIISIWCFLNVIFYLFILWFIDRNDKIKEFIQRYSYLKRIVTVYKSMNVYFIYFEIFIFMYINLTLIYAGFKVISSI